MAWGCFQLSIWPAGCNKKLEKSANYHLQPRPKQIYDESKIKTLSSLEHIRLLCPAQGGRGQRFKKCRHKMCFNFVSAASGSGTKAVNALSKNFFVRSHRDGENYGYGKLQSSPICAVDLAGLTAQARGHHVQGTQSRD
jgi:hypothetical protein